MSDIIKMYSSSKAKQYSGAEYDHLDYKIAIYEDYCRKYSLTEDDKARAFSSILSGPAENYYHMSIMPVTQQYTECVRMLREYFETPQQKHEYQNQWNQLIFYNIVKKHSDKSNIERFNILVNKFYKLRPGLSLEMCTDYVMAD